MLQTILRLRKILLASFLIATCFTSASAQGVLERLGKRLEQALPAPVAPVPPAEPRAEASSGYLGARLDTDATKPGVRVLEVLPGSPADEAGLRAGDLVVRVDGEAVRDLGEMSDRMDNHGPGRKLEMEVERSREMRRITATLGLPPDVPRRSENDLPAPRGTGVGTVPASLGITVGPVTEEARQTFRLAVRSGALIGSVQRGSAAEQAGLPIGGVIVAVDGQRIDTPDDLIGFIRSRRAGDEVAITYYRGGTLFNTNVKLSRGENAVSAGGEANGDRPVLRRIERAVEGLATPPAGRSTAPGDEVVELRREVDTLRQQVKDLAERLQALESQSAVRSNRSE